MRWGVHPSSGRRCWMGTTCRSNSLTADEFSYRRRRSLRTGVLLTTKRERGLTALMSAMRFQQNSPHQEPSEICRELSEWLSKAVENAEGALRVLVLLHEGSRIQGELVTALKKYVEDAGQAIKEIDNRLESHGSSLDALIFEVPSVSEDDMSWRNLIGRRDVIAHNLLRVDDERVHSEAIRDFRRLHQLLTKIGLSPFKVGPNAEGLTYGFATEALRNCTVYSGGQWTIGQSLIAIAEREQGGFISARIGRGPGNKLVVSLDTTGEWGAQIFGIKGERVDLLADVSSQQSHPVDEA